MSLEKPAFAVSSTHAVQCLDNIYVVVQVGWVIHTYVHNPTPAHKWVQPLKRTYSLNRQPYQIELIATHAFFTLSYFLWQIR